MPLIKPKYRDREIKLKELLHEFHDLIFEDQVSKLEYYCTEFGLYTSDHNIFYNVQSVLIPFPNTVVYLYIIVNNL